MIKNILFKKILEKLKKIAFQLQSKNIIIYKLKIIFFKKNIEKILKYKFKKFILLY